MNEHLYTHRKTSYQSASVPQHSSFQPRPFVVQPQTEEQSEQSEQPDIKTALQRAERYGHRLDRIKFAKTPAPAQRPQIVQAKLTIGEPGDKYEQEADRVAASVVNSFHAPTSQQSQPSQAVQRQEEEEEEIQAKPEITALQRQEEPVEEIQAKLNISDQKRSPLPSEVQQEAMPEDEELQTKPILQRREAIGGGEASTDVESAINSARGNGQPLEAGLQRSMGQAMGADFSRVKVHTDAQADRLNRSIQARAFTTGQDVFFRQGEYNPGSRGGQELVAHELTHVVQQGGSQVQRSLQQEQIKQVIQRRVKITDPLEFNVRDGKPTIGESVLNNPPEYLNADVDGSQYRLKAGQNFISESKGRTYIANQDAISGSDAKLLKPMVNDNEDDDVRVVGDGHHRLLFSAYHGKDCAGGVKIGFLTGQPWSDLKWKKDIKDK
jgi:hypothetical protein